MNNVVLKLDKIEKGYNIGRPNEVRVLSGLSLSIKAGEIVGLVAPSGTGKTTLLNVAGLIDSPDRGQIVIDGEDVSGAADKTRTRLRGEKIGFVYQFHHLLPEFSARENVMLPQLARGVAQDAAAARADMLLARVGLGARAVHRPAALSGGEAQRAAICRALANAPRLLLADEPTGNLDSDNSARVFDVLLEMVRGAGMGALIATHNLDLAAKMDRIIDLTKGAPA